VSTKKKIRILLIAAVVVLASTGVYAWWQNSFTAPKAVFQRMLKNSLSTPSVTKQSVVNNEAQSLVQTSNLFLGAEPRIHGMVEITQTGEQKSFVKRESLITPTTSFVRLVTIETTQKNTSGKAFDFSSVLGTWGQSPADDDTNSLSQLFGQNVAVPYANLNATVRHQLLDQIGRDNVYQVNYETVQSVTKNGRKAYVYNVGVKPEAFIKMMKTVGKQVGVKGFDQVDISAYKDLPIVKFVFTVDVVSGDLVSVDYGNSQIEDYSGVGMRNVTRNPKNSVSMPELQQRLQNLQR
jgi:hypothetical protein